MDVGDAELEVEAVTIGQGGRREDSSLVRSGAGVSLECLLKV